MGKKWDYDVPSVEIWKECLRVLKPGGHLLAFAGTRTQHRMAVRIEDGGFEIRDMIAWVYGSGFPKSHNGEWGGTALKPALEPITMARKPLIGTVAENFEKHGAGGLNVNDCRVEGPKAWCHSKQYSSGISWGSNKVNAFTQDNSNNPSKHLGRWPANFAHDGSDEVVGLFPNSKSCSSPSAARPQGSILGGARSQGAIYPNEDGSAARFFYCAKASKADRDEGCEGLEERIICITEGHGRGDINTSKGDGTGVRENRPRRNHHPTVKPTDLMRYLCRLVTPSGGTVLDPFMGSGSTGKAALLEGFNFIGIEREAEYLEIARARIADIQPSLL
jgi:site-specific DNA-methyltransferase (adenine-specific)